MSHLKRIVLQWKKIRTISKKKKIRAKTVPKNKTTKTKSKANNKKSKKREKKINDEESVNIEEIKQVLDDISIDEEESKKKNKKSTNKRSKSVRTKTTQKDNEEDLLTEIDMNSSNSFLNTQQIEDNISMHSFDFDIDLALNSMLEKEEEDEIVKELMKHDKQRTKTSKK